jgi:hypothetical protein
MHGSDKAGMRVGAISHTKDGVVYFYGYGVYEGDFPRHEGPGLFGVEAKKEFEDTLLTVKKLRPEYSEEEVLRAANLIMENPRIKLDNGKTVWGCQCWWGPEEKVKASIHGSRIVMVDVDQQIAAVRSKGSESKLEGAE